MRVLIHSMTLSREWRPLLVCLVTLASISIAGVPAFAHQLVGQPEASVSAADTPAADSPTAKTKDDSDKPKKKKKKKADSGDDAAAQEPGTGKTPKHPELKIGKDITLEFHARIEGDLRGATPDIGREDAAAEWQDRRLGIQGEAFDKRVTFEVSREFTHDLEGDHDLGEKTAWKDVYANYRVSKALNFEAGQFKLPFGREALVGETNLDFANRSLAARVLSPGRDIGFMTHGKVLKKRLEYQVGYFKRDGDNARTSQTEGGTDAFAGRVVVSPFVTTSYAALAPLELGVATENSRLDNRYGIRGRTVIGDGIFFDRVYVNGRRNRVGLEGTWAYGPVSLAAEYITVSDQRTGMGFDGGDLPNVRARAWYVAGTWALTGERKKGRIDPRRDLFRGGFGALELAARVEKLSFDSIDYPGANYGFPYAGSLTGNADRVTTLGVNWYLNHYLKIMTNVVMESIDDPERSPAPTADGKFKSVIFFLQFRL
jgi:phosphate-selective porin